MTRLNASRHDAVFSARAFGQRPVHIVGCGATGARVAISLARLGISNIHAWDFDHVEENNLTNQPYGLADIGKLKVAALQDQIRQQTGTTIAAHAERVDGRQQLLDGIVFLLTDTMSSRQEIWENGIRLKMPVKLMIETRLGTDQGRIYTVNPCSMQDVRAWEASLYSSEVATASACGTSITVGPTADILAGFAVSQLINWFALEQRKNRTRTSEQERTRQPGQIPLAKEIFFGVNPPYVVTDIPEFGTD